jgi:hypothetical protein
MINLIDKLSFQVFQSGQLRPRWDLCNRYGDNRGKMVYATIAFPMWLEPATVKVFILLSPELAVE